MTTTIEETLVIIDRVVRPISEQIQDLARKVEAVGQIGERVVVVERANDRSDQRLKDLETTRDHHATQLAEQRGAQRVIIGLLAIFGGPVAVALCLAGIAALFHIQIGN